MPMGSYANNRGSDTDLSLIAKVGIHPMGSRGIPGIRSSDSAPGYGLPDASRIPKRGDLGFTCGRPILPARPEPSTDRGWAVDTEPLKIFSP